MLWKKSPPDLLAAFEKASPQGDDVETRQMFGYPACFVRGNMFMGLHQDAFIVRLGEAERAALLSGPDGRTFEPMPGRPMKEYVVLSDALLADAAELGAWVARSLAYGRSLPAKPSKKATARGKAAAIRKAAEKTPSAKTTAAAAHKKVKPRATVPPRPRKQSGTVKKAARSR
jgi:TfoX/Sxy family transcriptional regulator of competence genes